MKGIAYLRSIRRAAHLFRKAFRLAVYHEGIGQYLPPKPTVLQLPVNDICNSHCIMCNIWQHKRDKEFTPDELRQILQDPLFSRVRYVGLSGGEPTLRPDLAQIAQVLVDVLPELNSIGITTNAIRPDTVIKHVLALAEIAERKGIDFLVNVSLDGIGADHDLNRGVTGNFISSVKVIETLQARGLPVIIGCTLTPFNCYGADDVLAWCEDRKLPWQFRTGVEIKRVYNDGYSQQYPFAPEQLFHLTMFFDKLAHHPQVSDTRRRIYQSLVGQLAYALPRTAGCDFRSDGVTLDTRGNISYCSVQSPVIGSAITHSALEVYTKGLPERRRILREHCSSCRHDLPGPPPPGDLAQQGLSLITNPWKSRLGKLFHSPIRETDAFSAPIAIQPATHPLPSQWRHVLITGWYGTETAGDKAILGELYHFLHTYAPDCKITLTTLDRKVSQQTNLEMPFPNEVTVVDLDKAHSPELIEQVDAVLIGGGPLAEIAATRYLWRIFKEANRQQKARILFGCGIGPIHTAQQRQIIGAICQMASAGFLRDAESRKFALELGASASLGVACDPAIAYVRRWASEMGFNKLKNESLRIIGLLRRNTDEFITDMPTAELHNYNLEIASRCAQVLEAACTTYSGMADLLPMHALWVGGDDRLFHRQVAKCITAPSHVIVDRSYLPLDHLLRKMGMGDVALAMRYHGHLFCLALGIPFVSIDYTGKRGKVGSLIERLGYAQWSEPWRDLDARRLSHRLHQLIEEREFWANFLSAQASQMVNDLNGTYSDIFKLDPASPN